MIDTKAVRRICRNQRLTLSEVAAKMGAHRPDVSAWANGRITPSLGNAARMAKALGCPLDDIVVTPDR